MAALVAVLSCWLAAGLAMLSPTAPALGVGTLLQARERLGLQAFVAGTPACPTRAQRCFGIVVHVVVEDGAPVQTPRWFADQLAAANGLFATIGVGFEATAVRQEPAAFAELATRIERDSLGRGAHDPHVVHVWVVRRLGDVDIAGEEIRGVHWRDRAEPTRRFVILSSIAGSRTLAHELGHFFGLPHSSFPVSIMNKTPREEPPWAERGFHPREYATMRTRTGAMIADGTLGDRPARQARPLPVVGAED